MKQLTATLVGVPLLWMWLLPVASHAQGMVVTGASGVGDVTGGLVSRTILSDGTVTTAPVSGDAFYWNGPSTPGNEVYRLVIGGNFHAVSGCGRSDFNAAINEPFNLPEQQSEAIARTNPKTGLPYPVRARFSCGAEPGDLPLSSTTFYLDDVTRRYYFPTGGGGEYYSFADRDRCVYGLIDALFKVGARISQYTYLWESGRPADLSTEIQIECGVPSGPYHLYSDQDDGLPPSSYGQYLVVESLGGSTPVYLPVHRINGDGVNDHTLGLLQEWLHIRKGRIAPLTEAAGFQSTTPGIDPVEGARANIATWKKDRWFWDLCLDDPSVTPSPCTHEHFLYGGTTPASVPVAFRRELLLHGELVDRAVNATRVSAPSFVGCEASIDATFGLALDSTLVDSRPWVLSQASELLRRPTTPVETPFRCPATTDRVCRVSLGGPSDPNQGRTYQPRDLYRLIDSAYASCSAEQRAGTLELTLHSSIDVVFPRDWNYCFDLNSYRFTTVSIRSDSGTSALRVHDQCGSNAPCLSGGRRRPLFLFNSVDQPRSLTLDHVALQYVADNLPSTPDGGAPDSTLFDLRVVFLTTNGGPKSRVRLVLTDSSIGADPDSARFLTQSLTASYADVFLVRSSLQGAADPASPWKALSASNALVVLDGRPNSSSPETGAGTPLAALRGRSGGLTMASGSNDVLAVTAQVDGVLVANAISQSIWIDSTLTRPPGGEAVHFTGTEPIGFPAPFSMMWMGTQAAIANLQSDLFVPVFGFDRGLRTVPRVVMGTGVKYFEATSSGSMEVSSSALESTLFCNTANGSVWLAGGLGQRCPTGDPCNRAGGTSDANGHCACFAGHAGPACEYGDSTTCGGHGVAQRDGSCQCRAGFVGAQCGQCGPTHYSYPSCVYCFASETCGGNGDCSIHGTCSCRPGYSGSACQFGDATTCTSHGTAHADGGCACAAGHFGQSCQYDDQTTCSGHGSVRDDGTCTCAPGFGGAHCAECTTDHYGYPSCVFCQASQTCGGHGSCGETGSCACALGYAGHSCEYGDAVTCGGHGVVDGDGSCTCEARYVGQACQYGNDTTCNGHGSARVDGTCSCADGFGGTHCAECATDHYAYPSCAFCQASQTCGGHGSCGATGSCTCAPGYAGPSCEYSDAVSCGEHGVVTSDGSCTCEAGYVGQACQYGNDTTCSGHGSARVDGTCSCADGFGGAHCAECATDHYAYPSCAFCQASQTCGGHGSCSETGSCTCAPGYAGTSCQFDDGVTCDGHGTAQANGGCDCAVGWSGQACDHCATGHCGADAGQDGLDAGSAPAENDGGSTPEEPVVKPQACGCASGSAEPMMLLAGLALVGRRLRAEAVRGPLGRRVKDHRSDTDDRDRRLGRRSMRRA